MECLQKELQVQTRNMPILQLDFLQHKVLSRLHIQLQIFTELRPPATAADLKPAVILRGMYIKVQWETHKERDNWKDLDVGGGDVMLGLREVGWDGMVYIDLTVGIEQWRALANTVMNLRVT